MCLGGGRRRAVRAEVLPAASDTRRTRRGRNRGMAMRAQSCQARKANGVISISAGMGGILLPAICAHTLATTFFPALV
jgi:hypothetical protein